jgi:hypothetical protein
MPSIDEMLDVAAKEKTPSVDQMLDAAAAAQEKPQSAAQPSVDLPKPPSVGDTIDAEMQKRIDREAKRNEPQLSASPGQSKWESLQRYFSPLFGPTQAQQIEEAVPFGKNPDGSQKYEYKPLGSRIDKEGLIPAILHVTMEATSPDSAIRGAKLAAQGKDTSLESIAQDKQKEYLQPSPSDTKIDAALKAYHNTLFDLTTMLENPGMFAMPESKLLSGYFTTQMARSAIDQTKEALNAKTEQGKIQGAMGAVVSSLFAGLGAKHIAGGKPTPEEIADHVSAIPDDILKEAAASPGIKENEPELHQAVEQEIQKRSEQNATTEGEKQSNIEPEHSGVPQGENVPADQTQARQGESGQTGGGGGVQPAQTQLEEPLSKEQQDKVRSAYNEIKQNSGFRDVLISDLQQRSGVPLKPLQDWLRQESRNGTVNPTKGDWSLSNENDRNAAIQVAGEPHLRVQLKDAESPAVEAAPEAAPVNTFVRDINSLPEDVNLFNSRMVSILNAWKKYRSKTGSDISLDDFKRKLVEESANGNIELKRFDFPTKETLQEYGLNHETLPQSEVYRGGETYHAIVQANERPPVQRTKPGRVRINIRREETPENYVGGPGAMGPKEAQEMQANRQMLSNKNAAVDEARVARGQQPLMSHAKQTLGEWWDQAIDIIAKDKEAGPKLVKSILADPSPKTSKTDEAVLLHHRVDLTNDIEQLAGVINNESASPEERSQAQQDYDKAMANLEDLDQATRKIGSTWGEAGRMRQASIADDYSPASLLRKAQAAQGGKPLTPEQVEEVTRIGAEITKAQEESDTQDKINAQKTEAERDKDAEKNIDEIKKRTSKPEKKGLLKRLRKEPTPEERFNSIVSGLKRNADNPDSIGTYIQKLAEHFVRQGIDQREPLVEAVHNAVKDILPDATNRDIRDAISGYGKYSELSKDAVKVKLRDLKGQMQQVSKIDDMLKKGQLPEKTGVERRKPSAEERTLIKEVNRIKKELQLESNDPTKLQGALDAIKTRLRNRIEELNLAISKGEKLPEKGRKVVEDEETKALRAERDRIQKEYDNMVGIETDAVEAAKERKLKQDIEELSRQIAVGEFEQQGRTGTATADTQKVAELKAQRDELLKQKREMIKAKTAKTPEERELLALEKRRDKLREKVASGDISTRTSKATVDTKEVSAVRDEIDQLNDQIAKMREIANPKPTEEELRERQLDKRIAEVEKKIADGDLSAKSGTPTVDTKGIAEKKQRLEELNKQLSDMRKAAKPRLTPDQIANKVYRTRTENRIVELDQRLKNRDFSKQPRKKLELDAESLKAKTRLEEKKLEFDQAAVKYRLSTRTRTERALDGLVKWNRAFLLSGIKTLAKLTSTAAEINLTSPIERLVGAGYGKLLPGLAKDAPRYGQISLRSEGKAVGEMWKNFFKDFTSELKTGRMDIDVLYGKPDVMPPELKNFVQHIHGALKSSARRNEFTRSLEARLENAALRGEDVKDPMVQTKYAVEAYKDANRAIYMEDNAMTNGWRRWMSALREPSKETGKVSMLRKAGETTLGIALPIVKIPTNLMFRYFEYSPLGLGTGAVRLARAFNEGFETLHPAEKELIFRNLARGTIGTAIMLWGAFNPDNVGGYYQRGEKRKPGDVKEGGLKIMGYEVPKFLIHHPLLEQAQIGASIRKLVESKLGKSEKEQIGYPSAGVAIAAKIISDIPFVGESLKINDLQTGSGQVRMTSELAKRAVPLGVQDIAQYLDKDEQGNPVKRDPQNAMEAVESALPVLRQNVPEKQESSRGRSSLRPPGIRKSFRPGSR